MIKKFRLALRVVGAAALLFFGGRAIYSLRPLGPMPEPGGQVRKRSAQDWGRIIDPHSGCVLVNNVWNKAAAGSGFEQEIFQADDGSEASVLGWRWRAPWQIIPRVVSQPQVVCGDKPWDEPLGLAREFPFRAGSKKVVVDFDARLRAMGTYNMAFTMWAVSSREGGRKQISHEIMIWTANGGQSAAGKGAGEVEINHAPFEFYIDANHGDASGSHTQSWSYLAFVSRKPILNGPLDLSAFLDHLLGMGLLTESHWVTSVEFGNEVCQGTGLVELRRFAVRVY